MKSQKRSFGDKGEQIAKMFLMKHGFTIVDTNFLKPWGEIDIIARLGGRLRFFEVKTAHVTYETNDRLMPEENIHPDKIKRLLRTIDSYLLENDLEEDWELGAIIVEIDEADSRAKVRYVESIVG
jgi:putative endonuclease